MSTPRVLILSSQTLFAQSLVILLEEHGYEVIAIQPFDDAALARVAAEQPSVVILDSQAAPPSAVTVLLECDANIRVVQVSLDRTVIASYDRRESSATVEDFLNLVNGGDVATPPGSARANRKEARTNRAEDAKL